MYRETMGLVKGIGIGMAAAAAVTMIGAKMMHRAMDAMSQAAGDVVGNVTSMMH